MGTIEWLFAVVEFVFVGLLGYYLGYGDREQRNWVDWDRLDKAVEFYSDNPSAMNDRIAESAAANKWAPYDFAIYDLRQRAQKQRDEESG